MECGLRPGSVYKLFDDQIRPPGWKWHICISAERRFFLRINSNPKWTPAIQITTSENPFLERDSYVELRELLVFRFSEVQQALGRGDNPLGHISRVVARQIVSAADHAPTLAADMRDLIREGLLGGQEEILARDSA